MRTRAFLSILFVAFVMLSLLADRGGAGQHVMTGTVVEWQADEFIAVANEGTHPRGVRFALRDTVYERDPHAIKRGIRVTVWYRIVGDRRPVADKVSN
jgi:hypothetical protein